MEVRVLSLNVAHLPRIFTTESASRRRARREALRALIDRERPDVVMFQEAWALPTRFIRTTLGLLFVARKNGPLTSGSLAVLGSGLVIASKFPLHNVTSFTYTSKCSLERFVRKGGLMASCSFLDTDRKESSVVLATTHMQTDVLELPRYLRSSTQNVRVQQRQAKQLHEELYAYLSGHNMNKYIVAGDFNVDGMGPPSCGRMHYGELQSVFESASPFCCTPTYPTCEYATRAYPERSLAIDHCFTNLLLVDAIVPREQPSSSDHAPILVTTRLPETYCDWTAPRT